MQHVIGAVVSRGGAVLWQSSPISSLKPPNPVDSLFRDSILASSTLKPPTGGSGDASGYVFGEFIIDFVPSGGGGEQVVVPAQ
jgi:hypothetical protein